MTPSALWSVYRGGDLHRLQGLRPTRLAISLATRPGREESEDMAHRLFICLLLLNLSGCASGADVLGGLLGGRVDGDSDRAAVSGADGPVDALPLAIAHCTRFGRSAQFSGREGAKVVFACVPK